MRKINKGTEPDFWAAYKKSHPREQYKDLEQSADGNELRRNLREYLLWAQHGLCGYCCRRIGLDNSLNEHIKPKSAYPNVSMDYGNIIASCRTEGEHATCGVKKENSYDEKLFVSPLEEGCEEEFIFYPNGQMEGVGERGKYTVETLNLNDYGLQRARMAQYKVCASYGDAELVYSYFLLPDVDGNLEAFADMVQYFYGRGDFGFVEI